MLHVAEIVVYWLWGMMVGNSSPHCYFTSYFKHRFPTIKLHINSYFQQFEQNQSFS